MDWLTTELIGLVEEKRLALTEECFHPDFVANVEVCRIQEDMKKRPQGYMAEITIECVNCDEAFRWVGLPLGLSWEHPSTDLKELVLNAPMLPVSQEDYDKELPGFSVKAWIER
jgi:hypothetical protein